MGQMHRIVLDICTMIIKIFFLFDVLAPQQVHFLYFVHLKVWMKCSIKRSSFCLVVWVSYPSCVLLSLLITIPRTYTYVPFTQADNCCLFSGYFLLFNSASVRLISPTVFHAACQNAIAIWDTITRSSTVNTVAYRYEYNEDTRR